MPATTQLQLQSTVRSGGTLELALAEVPLAEPGAEEVLVRVEAAPVNPSDLLTLLGPADPATAQVAGTPERPTATLRIPEAQRSQVAARIDVPTPCGLEGAGVVVKTGSSAAARALLGRTVALLGGPTLSQYCVANAAACLVLPEGTAPRDAASCFVNPLTALGMLETLQLEGHTGLVHTAAASNLGQMLVKLCRADGIPLVNVVRREEQVELLRGLGAEHALDSTADDFPSALVEALARTRATLCFDAIGGGSLAGEILVAMERALARGAREGGVGRYGTGIHKQVYVYGRLDPGPTVLSRTPGVSWGVGDWVMTHFLDRAGPEVAKRMRQRVVSELRTTFRSHYSREVSLTALLGEDALRACAARSTGGKLLVAPGGRG